MSSTVELIEAARVMQPAWAATPIADRLRPLRGLRRAIAADPAVWAAMLNPPNGRTTAESIAAELGPLADACKWLERNAKQTLHTRHEGRGKGTISLRVARKPFGVVLIIGAANYPLFLLAAPAIQALAAGNTVLLKPPPAGEAIARRFVDALEAGGLPNGVCNVLDSTVATAEQTIAAGVDHIVLTGSAETGRAVARLAAESLTPTTLECSGCDSVLVLPDAPLDRVVGCIAWGMRFNSGCTCIAPRRVVAGASQIAELGTRLAKCFADAESVRVSQRSAETAERLIAEALDEGAEIVSPVGYSNEQLARDCQVARLPPLVLRAGGSRPALADADLFAPVTTLLTAESAKDRIHIVNDCPYALGASVFGPADLAVKVAAELHAGCVTVNDLIAPTGDPRVPFGGGGQSGYGVTRGAEGLLAMTRPQAIARRHGDWLPHLDQPTDALDDLLSGMIQSQHAAGLTAKWRGLWRMISAARRHRELTTETRRARRTNEG